MILTLPMSGVSFNESYMEYIALGMVFLGFQINYMVIVNGCHNGGIDYPQNKAVIIELFD